MLRQNRDERQMEELDRLLAPPSSVRTAEGAPLWYGDDDEAWQQFQRAKAAQ
jgi:hypothetical protein